MTLLGDFWLGRREALPSAAIVQLLGEFGASEQSTRAALARYTRRGLLDVDRVGRNTSYRLTTEASEMLRQQIHPTVTFGSEPIPWDGLWTVVAFSIPESRREIRHLLRGALQGHGFALLYDGVWVSPCDQGAEAEAALAEIRRRDDTSLSATVLVGSTKLTDYSPLQAWDLEGLRRRYDFYIERNLALLAKFHSGALSARDALIARTRSLDLWRTFPVVDPGLPDELLPPNWPRRYARQLFIETCDSVGPLATVRVREILAAYDPSLADLATHMSSSAAQDLSSATPARRRPDTV